MAYQVRETASALGNFFRCYAVTREGVSTDIIQFFSDCKHMLVALTELELTRMTGVKLWVCGVVEFVRTADVDHETIVRFFGRQFPLLHATDIESMLDVAREFIRSHMENFEERGSNWSLLTIKQLDLHFSKYSPLKAAGFVQLPKSIVDKRAVINVKSYDEKCFLWSILAAIHPAQVHKNRVSNYERYVDELSFDGISFPVRITDIDKFTELNDISVNVYGCDSVIRPLRLVKKHNCHVNLLLYRGHYSLISHMDRFLSHQNLHNGRSFYCDSCLFPFYSQSSLDAHAEYCQESSLSRIRMPSPQDNLLSFQNIRRMIRNPVVVYADFECILKPISTCTPPPGQSHTEKLQEHVPCSFGAIAVRSCCGHDIRYDPYETYTGENCSEKFLFYLISLAVRTCADVTTYPVYDSGRMSRTEKMQFEGAKECWLCMKVLVDDRACDHCHVCGKFRGAAHLSCNVQLQVSKTVVVLMHNLRRYDGHILMRTLGSLCTVLNMNLSCTPKGAEDYISFAISRPLYGKRKVNGAPNPGGYKIVFVDSCSFLASSLEDLAKTLPQDAFHALDGSFPPDIAAILKRKGVFPYDYMDDWQKLALTEPPARVDFYNKLTSTDISEEDYQHMLNVWRKADVANLGEYMELYLKTDVLILLDVFEAFRKFSLDNFCLDPCHYLTLPSLGWDACLKLTGVKLELLTDPLMYAFFERGIRGGISTICQRYAKANNPYLSEGDYDPSKETSYIAYLDANNLYGWSMMQSLPVSEFCWMTDAELAEFDLSVVSNESDVGYVLEVDIDYPEELHDKHNCLPLAVERVPVGEEMLSTYCRELLGDERHVSSEKLVPNLCSKKNYIAHARNLKFYAEMGLKVTTIRRGIKFRQGPWMVPYIDFNTQRRKQATSLHEKNLHKLLNNAVFGKTMENVRKYQRVELVTTREKFLKLTKQSEFESATAFTPDLVACRMRQKATHLNKPLYDGFAVLDLSKLLMYSFHYGVVQRMYAPDKAKLLMTDTDSLMYQVKTKDVYQDFLKQLDKFDTSDYPTDHFLHSTRNKKVVGKMKDETNGAPISEFVGLRAKMYSFRCGDVEHKRAKGVKRQVVKATLKHKDYVDILRGKTYRYDDMRLIRSQLHNLYTVNLRKKSLAAFDDKRYILADGSSTLAYGHSRIPGIEKKERAAAAEAQTFKDLSDLIDLL